MELENANAIAAIATTLGAAHVGKEITKSACSLIERLTGPAVDELAKYLRDAIVEARCRNTAAILAEAERRRREHNPDPEATLSPRILFTALDQGAWIDEAHLRDLWAGLLASSCSSDGDNDSNIVFTSILERMTALQARIVEIGCVHARKLGTTSGALVAGDLAVISPAFMELTKCHDLLRLDREMDALRDMGLLANPGGFEVYSGTSIAHFTPTSLSLQMWCRCQGSRSDPLRWFGIEPFDRLPDSWYFESRRTIVEAGPPVVIEDRNGRRII